MNHPRPPDPVALVIAAFSQHDAALEWARRRLGSLFGPVERASPPFPFHHTRYYEPTMGPGLQKQFLLFSRLASADCLAGVKRQTIEIEAELAGASAYTEPRPLNLDPGVLTLGKFLLATTKDQAHRVYLRDGIFAEVTLRFHAGSFETWPWTYADYREPAVIRFLNETRDWYRLNISPPAGCPERTADDQELRTED
jgi:hypothetical protein